MVQIEPLVSSGTIEPLDIRILSGLAGLDVAQFDAVIVSPSNNLSTEVFWAIIAADRPWCSPPLDNVLKAANHPK